MFRSAFNVKVEGGLGIQQQLELYRLPPAKKRRVNQKLARKIRTAARKRIREQRDLQGKSYKARKEKKRGKMLRGLSKQLRVTSTEHEGVIDFASPVTAKIARLQQEGLDEKVTKAEALKTLNKKSNDLPATNKQARRLRKAGFKRKRTNGKGFVNASNAWIRENLTQGQAGIVMRKLEGKVSKNAWIIKGTARSFLGANKQDTQVLTEVITSSIGN